MGLIHPTDVESREHVRYPPERGSEEMSDAKKQRHETASIHFRETPEVHRFATTAGPDSYLCLTGTGAADVDHFPTYGQSEVRVSALGKARVILSPEQAEAVRDQLTAHLEAMGRTTAKVGPLE